MTSGGRVVSSLPLLLPGSLWSRGRVVLVRLVGVFEPCAGVLLGCVFTTCTKQTVGDKTVPCLSALLARWHVGAVSMYACTPRVWALLCFRVDPHVSVWLGQEPCYTAAPQTRYSGALLTLAARCSTLLCTRPCRRSAILCKRCASELTLMCQYGIGKGLAMAWQCCAPVLLLGS